MSDNSPNEFKTVPPKAAKLSQKPLIFILAGLGVLLAVFIYTFGGGEQEELASAAIDTADDRPLLAAESQSGLAAPPLSTPPPAPQEKEKNFTISRLPEDDEILRREREAIRQRMIQAHLRALDAPIGIRKSDKQESNNTTTVSAVGVQAVRDAARLNPGNYGPDQDKEDFFSRSSASDQEWLAPNKLMDGQPLEVKTGTVIPGAMITGINSDLPGAIIAQVSQNVYDSKNGQHLLIPQGAKLYGVYDSRVVYGQERVLIAWNRIIYPDGRALTLGAMPGADMSGYGGLEDEVDNHYLRIFGSAILMSLFTGGVAYTLDTVDSSRNEDDAPSMQNEMTAALAGQLGQTTASLLQKNLSIKPTLEIRPGFRFNVIVTKDLAFEQPYGK